ncbi:HAD-IIB family hydrolase [Solibacillus sp. FSL H8-0538]|uniref:HAD-IIB family hydrolase n=1 Tax=Solibacillus sp. FSL H8-0538 TaxID=2921400 RepID=UPI0030F96308
MKFIFDLDGTICFKGQPLSADICTAINGCVEAGHEVIFASARPIRDILPVLPKSFHGFRMVGGNGVFVYQNNEIDVAGFPEDAKQALLELIEEFRLPYLVDGRWDYSFTGDKSHPIFRNLDPQKTASNVRLEELDGIVKIVLFTQSKDIEERIERLAVTVHKHGDEGILDISPAGIHKWSGLQKLGLQEDEFIAFGNDTNDISMFNYAKESICVGDNAIAKAHATQFTTEAHVAQTIRALSVAY